MSPETGNIYVLLFNSKLLEICMRPTTEMLLRNFGKDSRVFKINCTKGIAIDYHRGHLLIAGVNSLCGWNVHKQLNPLLITNHNTINGADFVVAHNENFDHNYLQIVKKPGKILVIGNKVSHQMFRAGV